MEGRQQVFRKKSIATAGQNKFPNENYYNNFPGILLPTQEIRPGSALCALKSGQLFFTEPL